MVIVLDLQGAESGFSKVQASELHCTVVVGRTFLCFVRFYYYYYYLLQQGIYRGLTHDAVFCYYSDSISHISRNTQHMQGPMD